MALTSQMQTLRIDYDPALVPAGGAEGDARVRLP